MKRIEKPELRKKFWNMMMDADAKTEHQSYTRKIKQPDGTIRELEYLMRPRELERTKLERVFNTCLNWYVDYYNKMVASTKFGTYSTESNLPELLTSNPSIGHSAGCSDRTVRSMLSILANMGVLSKTNKGRNKGIGITFNASFLWGQTIAERFDQPDLQICPLGASTTNGNLFPHINTYRKSSEKEIISGLNKLKSDGENEPKGQRDKQIAPTDAPKQANLAQETQNGEKHTKGAGAESYPQQGVDNAENGEKQYDEWTEKCRQATMQFWGYAYMKLYSGRKYDKATVKTILRLIWTDVFHNCRYIRTEKELAQFLKRQTDKIDRAAKYYSYHPDAYLPDPHSIAVAGRGYFDKDNKRGFAGLEAWLKAEEAEGKKVRSNLTNPKEFKARKVEHLLSQAKGDFQKLALGHKPRVEVHNLDLLGLQQYYAVIFSHLGDNPLKRFNEMMVALSKVNFKPTYPKKSSQIYPEIVEVETWMNSFDYDY
jgi:hypothetical protein